VPDRKVNLIDHSLDTLSTPGKQANRLRTGDELENEYMGTIANSANKSLTDVDVPTPDRAATTKLLSQAYVAADRLYTDNPPVAIVSSEQKLIH